MPYDKEQRKAYNRKWREERARADPDFHKKHADRLWLAYWKDPEKKRQQNRESYYRTRGRKLPTTFKPYRIRDPTTRPEPDPKIQETPPTPSPQIQEGGSPNSERTEIPKLALESPPSFNMRDLFL